MQLLGVPKLRSLTTMSAPTPGTASRLKDSIDLGAGVETESFYSSIDSEEFCFKGGRFYQRSRVSVAEEEFEEKQLIPV